jgi:hypothetical protein
MYFTHGSTISKLAKENPTSFAIVSTVFAGED